MVSRVCVNAGEKQVEPVPETTAVNAILSVRVQEFVLKIGNIQCLSTSLCLGGSLRVSRGKENNFLFYLSRGKELLHMT